MVQPALFNADFSGWEIAVTSLKPCAVTYGLAGSPGFAASPGFG
jgi:hypothetical protein